MIKRRNFLKQSAGVTMATLLMPLGNLTIFPKVKDIGVQLYSFRDAMAEDAEGTLAKIAELGFTQIESARSAKGHYYGLSPIQMKKVCDGYGMTLRSGHVHLDKDWEKTMEEAALSGQEYLICSSMPSNGQTIDNYKKVADEFNKAGEACSKLNIKFGYHNHDYEFETVDGKVLYDVLMDNTDPKLVHMELDLGWVVASGKDPMDYFERYPGRFPLWHLKDMQKESLHSTEFGKGMVDVAGLIKNKKKSGVKYIFVEQEEYANNPFDSMRVNMEYLGKL